MQSCAHVRHVAQASRKRGRVNYIHGTVCCHPERRASTVRYIATQLTGVLPLVSLTAPAAASPSAPASAAKGRASRPKRHTSCAAGAAAPEQAQSRTTLRTPAPPSTLPVAATARAGHARARRRARPAGTYRKRNISEDGCTQGSACWLMSVTVVAFGSHVHVTAS